MKEWFLKYWIDALFGLVTTGLVAVLQKLARNMAVKFREQDAIKLGIQALLRDRIVQCYNHYQEKGFCPIYAMDNITALYTQYHALGGNGTVTELVERLKDMPTEIKKAR